MQWPVGSRNYFADLNKRPPVTQATSIAARWHTSPRTYAIDHQRGEQPVWKVDGVYVSLDGDRLRVEAVHRSPSPEMRIEIYDGELRLPLEDLVPQVLDRLDIGELARMICADDDARREVLEALARRYNEHGVEDADRRHWIAKVQASIHDARLDALTYSLTRIEQAVAQMGYRAMGDIAYANVLRHELERAGVDRDAALEAAERYPRQDQDLIDFRAYVNTHGGANNAWEAARSYWRGQLSALFPNVEAPEPSTEAEAEAA